MHVEDHPLEYGEFEGVIPEGYGAGIVMLWDKGTWTPEAADVGAALQKGDLKFTLDGYKLKGSWVLVRTRGFDRRAAEGSGRSEYGKSDGRSWLLIKHRDDWSGPIDIAEFAPLSVKSEGDFEDILAADTPAVWQSHKPGGQIGASLERIIQKVATMRAAGGEKKATGSRQPRSGKQSTAAKTSSRKPTLRRSQKAEVGRQKSKDE
jgi:bifunctional non-homologous end joining protein LigD